MSKEQTLLRAGVPSLSPGPGLKQKTTETPQIKEEPEEQSVKQEEEQLPVSASEIITVCVKREETSLLQQRQSEHREETQGEDISSSVNNGHKSGAEGAERKKHQCSVCNKRFGTRQQLKIHNRLHTGERPYCCSMCMKTFTQRGHLDSHMRTHTGEVIFNCSICEIDFSNHSTFKKHLRTHKDRPNSCFGSAQLGRKTAESGEELLPRAGDQIPSLSPDPGLNQGITETAQIKEEPEEQSVKQEEEQLPVPASEIITVCVKREESSGDDISSETEGQTELSSDTDDDDHWEPFSCSTAQMETNADGGHYNQVSRPPRNTSAPETSASVNNGHVSGAEGAEGAEGKKHQCPFCSKRFVTKQVLQNHIRVHTGDRPYSCSTCEKTFINKTNLQMHTRTHTGEKPFSCTVCEKTFALKFALKKHMRTHAAERDTDGSADLGPAGAEQKKHHCSDCNKRFWTKYHLQRHSLVHTGERPYSCSVCQETFTDKSVLKIHTRTHTGEKPYSCSICQKTVAHKSNLTKHMRTHTGEKPFSCSVCKKTFAQKDQVNAHTRTHKGRCAAVKSKHDTGR